jgi:energy-coupling factor transport system substrate-specific component
MQKLKLKKSKKSKISGKLEKSKISQTKKKEIVVVEKKSKAAQRLALHALQKQLHILKLREWLILISFVFGAALLRVPMQAMPNVEPLTFFAILAGWLFGKKKGFLAGASSLYISNFLVFGGQGPWTIFQVIGYGIAGFLGGFLRKKATVIETVVLVAIATLIMQIIFNIGWGIMSGFNIFLAFLTAIPFTLTHLVSNSIFALFLPKARKFIYEKGKFNEKELCIALINRARNNRYISRLQHPKKSTA